MTTGLSAAAVAARPASTVASSVRRVVSVAMGFMGFLVPGSGHAKDGAIASLLAKCILVAEIDRMMTTD
jgi:hypothetical protein